MKRRRTAIVALLLAAALIAAACGDSDDGETSATGDGTSSTTEGTTDTTGGGSEDTTTTTEAPQGNGGATDVGITEDTVKVALISEKSGSGNAASNGIGFDDGFEAYIEKINEEGGIDGRMIDLVAEYDDQGDAAKNADFFRQAFEQEQVFTVVGCFSKFGAVDYVEENELPVLGCVHDPPNWERSDWAHRRRPRRQLEG